MAAVPTRTFELEIAPLLPTAPTGVPGDDILPRLKELLVTARLDALRGRRIVPLGLRWRVTPALGLPRVPFSVFRRARTLDDPIDVAFDAAAANGLHQGGGRYRIPSSPLYVLRVMVRNTDPTAAVTVSALDLANRPLPLQTVQVPPNTLRNVRFQHPFLGGFSCRGGAFTLAGIEGVTMAAFIDRPNEWELIDVAGLPGTAGEIDGYDSGQQGDPAAFDEPPVAAQRRVEIAQQLYEPLPTLLPSGLTVPSWGIPTPDDALDELRGGSPSVLARLGAMFHATDTRAVETQAAFRALETMPGLHQPDASGHVTPDAVMSVPLLASVLLNAVTDPWFALASGFGTTDFPEFMEPSGRVIEPATYFNVSHDYMVSASFTFRLFEVEFKREHCALSHRSAFPAVTPGQLTAESLALNRPPHRDNPWSFETSLTWAKINRLQIQGNAVVVADAGHQGGYLNAPRPATPSGKLALFVPAKPGETSDPLLHTRNRFIHHGADVPFSGVRALQYGVAAMDAFGRWSDWSVVSHSVAARPPEAPRLMALTLTPDMSRVTGSTVPYTLSFEVLWDWQDRSPARFQLAGVFHQQAAPPAAYPGVFQTDSTATSGPLLELTFPSDVPPGTAPAFTAVPTTSDPRVTIELLPQATNANGQNVEGEMRRYRVGVADVHVTFAPDEDVFFSVFVKAAEWRAPTLLSDDVPPLPPGRPPRLTAHVPNPIPAAPPVFTPATVLWAALPDARNVSRFRLAFDRVPTATAGYAVYRAYEAKLRELAGLPVVTGVDLTARATELRDVAMPRGRCVDAFARLNATLVPQPPAGTVVEFEAELPGHLDGLVAFAVSSVTRAQEASPLSTPWLFVAVPRRVVPSAPVLTLAGSQNGTTMLACELARAPSAGRVEILRARREFAAREAGTMGPPIHVSEPSAWQALDDAGRSIASPAAAVRFRCLCPVETPPSWFPYLYRAVAIGAGDETTGLVPGRSEASNLVTVDQLPKRLPVVDAVEAVQTGSQRVTMRFRSDALIEPTPHGSFVLHLHAYDVGLGRFGDDAVLTVTLPRAVPRPSSGTLEPGALFASAPDAEGLRTFETVLAASNGPFMFRVRLTDPLGRASERVVAGTVQAVDVLDLGNLAARRRGRDVLIHFTSATPVTRPPGPAYRLEIGVRRDRTGPLVTVLVSALHEIRAGNLATLTTSTVTAVLRSSETRPPQPSEYGAIIKNLLPTSPFPGTPDGFVRVTLTAPDGATVHVEAEF